MIGAPFVLVIARLQAVVRGRRMRTRRGHWTKIQTVCLRQTLWRVIEWPLTSVHIPCHACLHICTSIERGYRPITHRIRPPSRFLCIRITPVTLQVYSIYARGFHRAKLLCMRLPLQKCYQCHKPIDDTKKGGTTKLADHTYLNGV